LLVISMLSNVQVLPQDVLVSESGELTELGRSYTPPRVLLDALCVVCSAASQWGDPTEAENMAMETLILDVDLQSAVGLLEATLKEGPAQITRELPAVLQVLMPLLHSPLAAPRIQQVFLDIGVCLMPKHLHNLGVLVGHVTLRLLKPECDLDQAWGEEDLDTAAHRTVLLLNDHTVPQREGKTAGSTEETESMMTRALQVISVHCQLRASTDGDDMELDEVLASQCLTALCASAGGGDGCTVAEQPEIDVLLNALLSPCFSVRDASLRVTPLFLFFVPDALNDRHNEVRRCMLDAALSALNTHGKVLFLFPAIKDDAAGIVRNLLQLLLESDKYAERKGAAYGLAGLVKGLGILALKQQNIMATLTDAIQDKKNFRRREGALFAFEMLCNMLGKLFEPYVVHVLPHLLLCFGDGNQYVREVSGHTGIQLALVPALTKLMQ
ncbi:hypothetical protein XENOCAPTIV_002457, partial [Xenoophorus captivus]